MTIRWEHAQDDVHRVTYFIDEFPVGVGDRGFDKILGAIRAKRNLEVTLTVQCITSLGGGSLMDSFPFGERFNELREALGENKLIYVFA